MVKLNALSEVNSAAFAPVLSSAALTAWNGFRLERHRIFDDATTPEICFPAHIIGFVLSGSYKKNVPVIGSCRTVAHKRGNSLLYPAELPHVGHSFSKADFLVLYLEPKFVERAAQEIVVGEHIEIVPQPKFESEFVGDIAKHLLAEVETKGATGKLYAESLMTALAVSLVKNYSTARLITREYLGGLAKHKLRLTVEFIKENLSEDLSLGTLAALCGLSYYHFAKAFKHSTGFAPHRYVLQQRVELAKRQLWQTDLPLVEIAFRGGFNSQSHFSNVFRQMTGATPAAYRAARK